MSFRVDSLAFLGRKTRNLRTAAPEGRQYNRSSGTLPSTSSATSRGSSLPSQDQIPLLLVMTTPETAREPVDFEPLF
jgi:hypothetical protein